MREIVLDTETTGFRERDGDRIVEIGCVELLNHVATGNTYHQYINPERSMPADAFKVHGLSEDFLCSFPTFREVADDFLDFLGDKDPLVIHNAEFDIRFINAELSLLNRRSIPISRAIDTVRLARRKFPGSPANLDALCKRFSIDNKMRELHGALLDAELLSEVYLELIGGKQPGFELSPSPKGKAIMPNNNKKQLERRPHQTSQDEEASHTEFMKKLKNPIWLKSG